jgi:Xaa-Pro dipeptidase
MSNASRFTALLHAEDQAMRLLDAIERDGLVAPGRTEREVEKDIYDLAAREFGVEKHWHKRIIRTGANTLTTAGDNPPERVIEADDLVFVDLGPVFEEWEADVGRTYVLGNDPEKQRLCRDLSVIFEALRQTYLMSQDITGAELYARAQELAEAEGWVFGGKIAGHLVGEFPHARIPGDKIAYNICPQNSMRMRDPDGNGQEKHWILEVHLVNRERSWGGFYERLLQDA